MTDLGDLRVPESSPCPLTVGPSLVEFNQRGMELELRFAFETNGFAVEGGVSLQPRLDLLDDLEVGLVQNEAVVVDLPIQLKCHLALALLANVSAQS